MNISLSKNIKMSWEHITSIEYLDYQHVYDLQIEETHNFVAGHLINKRSGKALTKDQEEAYYQYLKHQKTALTDGFNASVDSKLSNVSRTELLSIYHKTALLSSLKKNASVDRTGFEPAPSVRETDSLPLTYRPKFTEAQSLSQILGEDVNEDDIVFGGIVTHNTYISGNLGIGFTSPDRVLQLSSDINIAGTNASLLGTAGTQFSLSGNTADNTQKKLVLGIDTTDNYGVIQAGNSGGTNYALSLSPAGGNVGIGTTTANSTLTVVGNASIGGLYTGTSPPANSLFVHGNLGVGNTTSNNKLDVWGNARIAGSITVDSCTGCGGVSSWSDLTAPSASLSLNHAANTTSFTFNSVTTGDALTLSSTALTTGNLLTLNNTNSTSTGSNISIANSGTGAAIEYTTTPIAAGATGSYSTLTYLPQALVRHAISSYNGYLLVTGGTNTANTRQSTVYSAPIKSDGTIGAFSTLTYLPQALDSHAISSYNGYLLVTGGDATTVYQSTVYSAPIKADGTIGTFSTLTYLPQALFTHSLTSYNGYLFVTGGRNAAVVAQSTVYSAPIKADGTIGTFSTLTYLPQDRYNHTVTAYNGYLFVSGGSDQAGTLYSTVWSAQIKSNGTIGTFSTLTYLPQVLLYHTLTSSNGYLLVTGGQSTAGAKQSTVYSTPLQSTALAVNTSNNFATGNLLDLWNNSISKFSVDYAGNLTTQGNYTSSVVPKSDGTTGTYSTLTYLPDARYYHTATAYNGYLLVSGGLDGGIGRHSTVWSAPIKADGTIGAFTTLTYLPDERYQHTAAAYNGYLLVSGGQDVAGAKHSTVWSAPIKADGTIGAFTTLTYLPDKRYLHTAAAYNGYLLVSGGADAGDYQSTVWSAPIKADGTIGSFSTLTYLPDDRYGHTATAYNGYLFVTGGQDGTGVHSTVWSAPIKADGTIGAFTTLTYLPDERVTHTATAYNGYLLVSGGFDAAGASQSTVYSAPIKSDGTIGSFSTLTYLPDDRYGLTAAAYNGYLFVSGGLDAAGATHSTAWSTPLTTSRAFIFNANSQTWPEGTGLGGNASLWTLQNNGDAVANFTAYGDLLLRGKLSANSVVIGTDVPGDLAENFPTSDPSMEAGDVVVISHQKTTLADGSLTGNTSSEVAPDLSSVTLPQESANVNSQDNANVDLGGVEPPPPDLIDQVPHRSRPTSPSISQVEKSGKPYDNTIVGVISTSPSITLSPGQKNGKPVALSGRVLVKVSLENGPIEAGDFLTSSSTPGVAMKATKPGQVIGKALEEFSSCHPEQSEGSLDLFQNKSGDSSLIAQNDNTCIGKILSFVNVSFADPGNFLANLSLDADGNLIAPRLKVDKLEISGNLGLGVSANTPGVGLDSPGVSGSIDLLSTSTNQTQAILGLESYQATASARMAELEERIASLSAAMTSSVIPAKAGIQSSESGSELDSPLQGNDSSLNLTPPDILYATSSAQPTFLPSSKFQALSSTLSEATVSGMLTAYSAQIQDNFKVLGTTTLSDTLIAGDLTIDGTFSISGNSINVIGSSCHPEGGTTEGSLDLFQNKSGDSSLIAQNDNCGILYLQSSPLSQGLDIFNGKVTIDKDGNVKASTLEADQLKIRAGKSAGKGTIIAGATQVIVENPYAQPASLIFVTPKSLTYQTLAAGTKQTGSFTVRLSHPEPFDINFEYLIVGLEAQE